jgi:membrane-associated phospholipid phosphatase
MRRVGLAVALCMWTASASAEPARGEGPHRIEWKYPRFRTAELTWTLGVALTTAFVESRAGSYSPDNGWHDPILFDNAVRNALVARSHEGRALAARWSDRLWHPTQYYPVVVDGLLIPLLTDNFNTDAALQMTLLNWEVQTTAVFLLRIGHRTIGRWRPSVQGCDGDPSYDGSCNRDNPSRNGSFPGGHCAMSFAGAALTCAHHANLRLYGSTAAGNVACGVTMTTATAVMLLRIVSDNHWATDSLVGAGLGLGVGFGMPYLLHYGPHLRSKVGAVTMVPWTDARGGIGLGIAGMH